MATNTYLTLSNSDGTLTRRFRVLFQSFSEPWEKRQTVRETVTGVVDVTEGPIARLYSYALRAHAEAEEPYGTLANLQTFFGYNNPNGAPSNVLRLTPPAGDPVSVYFLGALVPVPQTPMLTGPNAWFLVPVTFRATGE